MPGIHILRYTWYIIIMLHTLYCPIGNKHDDDVMIFFFRLWPAQSYQSMIVVPLGEGAGRTRLVACLDHFGHWSRMHPSLEGRSNALATPPHAAISNSSNQLVGRSLRCFHIIIQAGTMVLRVTTVNRTDGKDKNLRYIFTYSIKSNNILVLYTMVTRNDQILLIMAKIPVWHYMVGKYTRYLVRILSNNIY